MLMPLGDAAANAAITLFSCQPSEARPIGASMSRELVEGYAFEAQLATSVGSVFTRWVEERLDDKHLIELLCATGKPLQ